jgi:hypothetical protein
MKQQLIKEVRKLQEIAGIEEIVVKPATPISTIYLVFRHDGEPTEANAFTAFRNREAAEEYGDNLNLEYSIIELDLN